MNEKLVFYSWQDNLSSNTNRKFIENILNEVISEFNKDIQQKIVLDQATREIPGIPDIVQSILKKIDRANLFIADITTVCKDDKERNYPNSNVLFELGYAIKCLGTENIICLFNLSYGEIERLPFDIKQRRITSYYLPPNCTKEKILKEKNKIKDILKYALKLVLDHQSTRDTIFEIFKPQIDQIILNVYNQINDIVGFKKERIFLNDLFEILEYKDKQIEKCVKSSNPEEIALMKNWNVYEIELEEITRHPLLIVYDDIGKITSIMKFKRIITIINRNFAMNRFYEKKPNKSQREVQDAFVLVFLLKELIKSTDQLLKSWGNLMMIDPAFIE